MALVPVLLQHTVLVPVVEHIRRLFPAAHQTWKHQQLIRDRKILLPVADKTCLVVDTCRLLVVHNVPVLLLGAAADDVAVAAAAVLAADVCSLSVYAGE